MTKVSALRQQEDGSAASGKVVGVDELQAQLDRLGAQLADLGKRTAARTADVKRRSVALMAGGDYDAVRSLFADEIEPLEAEERRLTFALEAAREAFTEAQHRKREELRASATQTFRDSLEAARPVFAEAEEHLGKAVECMMRGRTMVLDGIESAKGKLSVEAGKGFRLTGVTVDGFLPDHVKRAAEIYMHATSRGFWRCDTFPPMARVTSFRQMMDNAISELLQNFDVRYRQDHPGDAGENAARR